MPPRRGALARQHAESSPSPKRGPRQGPTGSSTTDPAAVREVALKLAEVRARPGLALRTESWLKSARSNEPKLHAFVYWTSEIRVEADSPHRRFQDRTSVFGCRKISFRVRARNPLAARTRPSRTPKTRRCPTTSVCLEACSATWFRSRSSEGAKNPAPHSQQHRMHFVPNHTLATDLVS